MIAPACGCQIKGAPACRCEGFVHPQMIFNSPGQDTLHYRAGDFVTFRHALLLSRAGEIELTNWRPGASGDLAVQMVEWWAYLADILTFYNERVANEDYLDTAVLPESVTRLIRILGYRPRPGIGARATLAVLLSGTKSVHLDAGFSVQSKPGPGKQPQIFELESALDLLPPDAVAADPPADSRLFQDDGSILLKGVISSLRPGDEVLIAEKNWAGKDQNYALVKVASVQQEKDPRGKPNTRVQLSVLKTGIPDGAAASDYQLLRSMQKTRLWQYPADTVVDTEQVELESAVRSIAAGQILLFEVVGASRLRYAKRSRGPDAAMASGPKLEPQAVLVTQYSEALWYANPKDSADPTGPPDSPTVAISMLHSSIGFGPALVGAWNSYFVRSHVLVHYDFRSVAEIIATPVTTFDGVFTTLAAVERTVFRQGNGQAIQIEGADGVGVTAAGSVGTNLAMMQLSNLPDPAVRLKTPLRVLCDLLPVSRGKTVLNEVLGSGNAAQPNQEFVLSKSPLTYLLSGDSTSGESYKSTLQIWVDGLEWKEAPSFYGQSADARIFVTAENENQKTHVKFGDGINGARLSTGANNVIGSYRYGSGRESPDPGSLTVILKPQPGLKSLRNPVAASGGADPDPPDQIRQYAPRSVLTFGRAVSGDDYETIAAQTPGVSRARAYWGWDDDEQRTVVKVYVGDDQSAKDAANVALAGAADANRPLLVSLARLIPIQIGLTLEIEADRIAEDVHDAVMTALIDPDHGLLGENVVRIGQGLYESQIYEACLSVPGVVAVHGLQFSADRGSGMLVESSFRYDPGEGEFFQLNANDLTVTP